MRRFIFSIAKCFSIVCFFFMASTFFMTSTIARAETHSVDIKNYAFEPATIIVKTGGTITWINKDDDPHTVKSVAPDEALKSAALDTNEKFSFTFTKPGVYKYFCTLHPHMQGEIVVQ